MWLVAPRFRLNPKDYGKLAMLNRAMRRVFPRLIVPGLAFGVLGIGVLLYCLDRPLYVSLMTHAFVSPFRYPFLDLEYITALVQCWHDGVNVYLENPCDALNRPNDYSPLWLRMSFLPTDKAWTPVLGLSLVSVFIISLSFIPLSTRRSAILISGLATFSSVVVFAIERGNIDMLMLVLAIAAAYSLTSRHVAIRLVGYSLILIAGLLKIYPLVMFIVALREKPRMFLAIGLASFGVGAAFVWCFAPELHEMLENIPVGSYFSDRFGAVQFPGGIGFVYNYFAPKLGLPDLERKETIIALALIVLTILLCSTLGNAARLALRADFRLALADQSRLHTVFLVFGAALTVGCFLTNENIGYRAIVLLLALPIIMILIGSPALSGVRSQLWATALAILFVMWQPTISFELGLLAGVPSPYFSPYAIGYIHWLANEMAWWWLISVLGAFMICFVIDSRTVRDVRIAASSFIRLS